jgi:hypothetical protein
MARLTLAAVLLVLCTLVLSIPVKIFRRGERMMTLTGTSPADGVVLQTSTSTHSPSILASFQTHMLLRSLLNILMYIAQVMAICYTAAVCAAEGASQIDRPES